MALLITTDYPQIRAALDVSFGKRELPDDIIGLDIYLDAGMQRVLDEIPSAESLTGTALKRAKRAAILYTAALIAPAVPNIVTKSLGGQKSLGLNIDWSERALNLEERAAKEILALDEVVTVEVPIPTFMTTASGRRGL